MSPPPITVLGCIEYGVKSLPFIAPYFAVSVALTFYNKWLLNGGGEHDLPFPLSITVAHLTFTFFVIWVIRRWSYPGCRDDKPLTLGWGNYVYRVVLPAVAGGLDIGLSNWSLVYITVSLYAMSKSTCIIFILFFSVLLGLEKAKLSLFAVVGLIFSGVFMFTFRTTKFDAEGFFLVMTAAFLGGVRWSFSQLLMQNKDSGLSNPVDIVFHLLPCMLVVLAPMAMVVEGYDVSVSLSLISAKDFHTVLTSVFLILFGAVLACLLNLFEFLLLSHTSGLTLSIVGIFKEISIFPIAHSMNGDQFTAVNVVGCIVCVCGIVLHTAIKASRAEEGSSSNGIRAASKSQGKGLELSSLAKLGQRRRNPNSSGDLAALMQDQGNSSEEDLIYNQTGV
ncbi:solute carrier family 35 member C2-like [Sycon ciliatum]|uniref:solute carrier family 35 member C2-like n=1 Tax=Sycon ciliatum TaxID=27933 RepID=UPI0031F707E7|eukprot:scpid63418/ scgid8004/ Solute carrier family 35 member C2; Ovarian cancer-overexpressed gene 1 protein